MLKEMTEAAIDQQREKIRVMIQHGFTRTLPYENRILETLKHRLESLEEGV